MSFSTTDIIIIASVNTGAVVMSLRKHKSRIVTRGIGSPFLVLLLGHALGLVRCTGTYILHLQRPPLICLCSKAIFGDGEISYNCTAIFGVAGRDAELYHSNTVPE